MEIIASFDYGHVLISSAIMAGFVGFSVFFSSKFTPLLYTHAYRKKITRVYQLATAIILSQIMIIVIVIVGWYQVYLHLSSLLLMIACTIFIAKYMLELRHIEANIRIWKDMKIDENEGEKEGGGE